MDVGSGDMVVKGEVIGRTGTTGWAGGDHLHYGMFVDHIFVNPAEWWDPSWIKNNITDKIQSAGKVKN
jgi:murein DD-endopeptidase MepM/ murein hydrolase activator NlpD